MEQHSAETDWFHLAPNKKGTKKYRYLCVGISNCSAATGTAHGPPSSLSAATTSMGLILTGSNGLTANSMASIGPAANSTGLLVPTAASYVGVNWLSLYLHGLYWPRHHFRDAFTGSIAPKATSVTS